MKWAIIVVALGLALAGCQTTPKTVVEQKIVEKKVAVREPCIEKAPVKPVYRYGKGEAPKSDAEMVGILGGDFEAAEQYGIQWEAVAAGCIKPAAK